jgi:hypothetical protein
VSDGNWQMHAVVGWWVAARPGVATALPAAALMIDRATDRPAPWGSPFEPGDAPVRADFRGAGVSMLLV